ncbi:MAG: hypothetical protein WA197_07015, partial [Candidatus Acidiferrales bacterium]
NATFRSRKKDMVLVSSAFISTMRANGKAHIVNYLPWAASLGMLVFGSPCPNSDSDFAVESRDTWRVVAVPTLHSRTARPEFDKSP